VIAQANACLEGLAATSALSATNNAQFKGEAEFLRAYGNFYLVNLFGDIPLINTTEWTKTNSVTRSSTDAVYAQIISDLTDAQASLPASYASGQVIRATKWAAAALLARVQLYRQQWASAEQQATSIIDGSGLSLTGLNNVFLIGSTEAIFQLQPPPYHSNPNETLVFVNFGTPNYLLTTQQLNAFETGDQRKTAWVDSLSYNGQTLYYPYKYKSNTYNPPSTEYYMVLRLAEQYLIRAEARAKQDNISGAVADLNLIRERAGLTDLSTTIDQATCLLAVEQERRVELFAEWGHRWFDLKRTNRAAAVLPAVKPKWTANAEMYPIPVSEIILNPHLTQNPGYN
jgi:hypothetical protein